MTVDAENPSRTPQAWMEWKPLRLSFIVLGVLVLAFRVNYCVRMNGTDVKYYANGVKMCETPLKNGIPEGMSIGYYKSGRKKAEFRFENGYPEGMLVQYYESGGKMSEFPLIHGKREGVALYYYESGEKQKEVRFSDSRPVHEVTYYRNGCIESETPYMIGQKHGASKQWDEQGNLSTVFWNFGKPADSPVEGKK